ncbi:hypothetical protein ALC60_01126, partial [Trachymyrmex zeteki]
EYGLGAVKPPPLGQQGSKGPSPCFQHYTLVSFDNFISYSALFPAVRFYVLHEQMEKRHDPSWTFFHEKTPTRIRDTSSVTHFTLFYPFTRPINKKKRKNHPAEAHWETLSNRVGNQDNNNGPDAKRQKLVQEVTALAGAR